MEKHTHQSHTYYIHGSNPRILLLSGMHGDEYESGRLFLQFVMDRSDQFPEFLYIPQVSPTAVSLKTRKNIHGHDINRYFLSDTKDPEVLSVMEILKNYTFDRCIDIHEDPDRTGSCYLYDTDHMNPEELEAYRACVRTTGAELYSGIDDVEDKHLMLEVDKGYISLEYDKTGETSGFSSRWLFEEGIVKRTFTVEVPGKATPELKDSIIRTVTTHLLTQPSFTNL